MQNIIFTSNKRMIRTFIHELKVRTLSWTSQGYPLDQPRVTKTLIFDHDLNRSFSLLLQH